ncbi:hypothetical protein GCM10011345_36030 [Gemmobacter megaterium]|nr:hypothetical protein GCM10011345_36030 [Gemmobacter megaterium]
MPDPSVTGPARASIPSASLGVSPNAPHPAPWATHLTAASARRGALSALRPLANPDCPTCGGTGWHTRRVEFGVTGTEAVACHCTEATP